MISYHKFGELRLGQFLAVRDVTELQNWEFEGYMWVGEAFGFSEWLRLESDPTSLRSLSIDFTEFPSEASRKVLKTLGLPLRQGMVMTEIEDILGEPCDEFTYVADRKSYEFMTRGRESFIVSCTVLNEGGLTYLVVRMLLAEFDDRNTQQRNYLGPT